jgi:1-aminocyclopropane-1-carboxylate deaminase/D-cysteine desulfhydrase-like pyridoxal-dependent ACC family enzyme
MAHGSPLSLFERYPGTAVLPLAGIATLPTPIEWPDAQWFEDEPIGPVWVKRDDLTSAAYGGNKVRKLDFLLGDALEKGATSVLTFGAYGSNHALATAVHARALGLEPHVVLSPQEPGPFAPATLLAHAGLGTVLHLAEGWDGKRVAVAAIREVRARDGIDPYVIPMGGTNDLGAVGYVNAALEVIDQIGRPFSNLVQPDVVYCAAGTLGTAIGLAIGFAAAGVGTRVEAIRVTPLEVASQESAERLVAHTVALLRSLDPDFPRLEFGDLAFTLRSDHFDPGYGVVTPQTEEAVRLAEEAGLKLETTYTGKAFSAMLDDARKGRLRPDEHVLFWDTYSSAPMPPAGSLEALPELLREYIAECERLFGALS